MVKEREPKKNYPPLKRLKLAGGFALSLALASCAPEPKAATPTPTEPKFTPTPIATEVPSPTPELTFTSTPEATPTPEPSPTPEFQFEPYGVYVGDVEGGGKVIFASLPDGRLAFASIKPEPSCSDPNFSPPYVFAAMRSYQRGRFGFFAHPIFGNQVMGNLTDEVTVSGGMSSPGREIGSPSGPIICEPSTFTFKAILVGHGKEVFLEAFRTTVQEEIPGYGLDSQEKAQALFESFCGIEGIKIDPQTQNCKLP